MNDYYIVQIEDEANQWQPLTMSLTAAIGEYLSLFVPQAFSTLTLIKPKEPHKFPSHSKITWHVETKTFAVNYWFVTAAGVDEIADQLGDRTDVTFVLDVMRKKGDDGLYPALEEILPSIQKYVADEASQVRLFTAYSEADDVGFPSNHPTLIKKGVDTSLLLSFLMARIGLGEA